MLVTGTKITTENLLQGSCDECIRSGGYYLRIHKILPLSDKDGRNNNLDAVDRFELEAGASAWVVSEELFSISATSITALVTLRSSLTKKGIVAFDVGLVDANFHGPIGTVLVNISKNSVVLNKGDQFLRTLFISHDPVDAQYSQPPKQYTHESYINERRGELVRDFPAGFLQIDAIEERILSRIQSGYMADIIEKKIIDIVIVGIVRRYWEPFLRPALKVLKKISLFLLALVTFIYLPSIYNAIVSLLDLSDFWLVKFLKSLMQVDPSTAVKDIPINLPREPLHFTPPSP